MAHRIGAGGRRLMVGAAAAVASGAIWCAPGLAVHSEAVARAIGVRRRLHDDQAVLLTFDDGPHPEGTPAVLEVLREGRARAVFFVVGEQVLRHRSLIGELVAAGHEVAVHAHEHRNQMRLAPPVFRRDLRLALEVIGDSLGRRPTLYRPPYGAFTPAGLATVRRAGLSPLLWSRWGRDWRADASPESIAAQATRGLRAGDVILLHDSDAYCAPATHRRTARALPAILEAIGRVTEAARAAPRDG